MNETLHDLLTASAVRQRCHAIGKIAENDGLDHFRIDNAAIPNCVDLVIAECLENYPDLNIPYHSRWRHFTLGVCDLWQHYVDTRLQGCSKIEIAKTAIDLVFVSVLLDAGAGGVWKYKDSISGRVLQRSEGLAAASLDLFFNGLLNGNESALSAVNLERLDLAGLMHCFQVDQSNPLVGTEGRLQLLHNLAGRLNGRAGSGFSRPGDLIDIFDEHLVNAQLPAAVILQEVLKGFNEMWPSGLCESNVFLGDCGYHSKLEMAGETNHLVAFHKLSQWLSYSLVEPLQWAGFSVVDLDALTGLPEYRNGGLFIDCGLLQPRNTSLTKQKLDVTSEPVVEWRALTVYYLDLVANEVRNKLGKSEVELPLASILQGGTWSAGRKLASDKRKGNPPINLAIDGTIF